MHPVLLRITDSFYLPTYGLIIAIGILLALALGSYRAKARGLSSDIMFDLAFIAILAGFAGGRILYIIVNFQEFKFDPMGVLLSRSGFVFLGGLIGGVAASIWYLKKKGLPVFTVGDVAAPSLALAHGIGRIACYMAGCCFGGVCRTDGLGVTVDRQVMPGTESLPNGPDFFYNAYEQHLHLNLIQPGAETSLPVWPVQLMEMGGLFLIAGILILFNKRFKAPGLTMMMYLGLYSILRFILEYFRGDLERGGFGGFSTSQIISLILLPIAIGGFLYLWKHPRNEMISATEENSESDGKPSGRKKRFT